jgi:hypothetical protein
MCRKISGRVKDPRTPKPVPLTSHTFSLFSLNANDNDNPNQIQRNNRTHALHNQHLPLCRLPTTSPLNTRSFVPHHSPSQHHPNTQTPKHIHPHLSIIPSSLSLYQMISILLDTNETTTSLRYFDSRPIKTVYIYVGDYSWLDNLIYILDDLSVTIV